MNFDNLLNKNTKILIITSNDLPSYIDRKWIDDLIEFIKFNKSIITGLVLNDTFNYQQTAGLFFFKQLGDVIRDQQLTSITKLDIGNNGEIGNWVVDLWLMRRDIENYLPNLKSLNIENSRITLNHEIILRLQALQTLEVLNLDNNIFYDCELTLNLVLQLPKLRSISIVGNGLNVNYSNHKHILESFFAQLSTKLTMIEYIKFGNDIKSPKILNLLHNKVLINQTDEEDLSKLLNIEKLLKGLKNHLQQSSEANIYDTIKIIDIMDGNFSNNDMVPDEIFLLINKAVSKIQKLKSDDIRNNYEYNDILTFANNTKLNLISAEKIIHLLNQHYIDYVDEVDTLNNFLKGEYIKLGQQICFSLINELTNIQININEEININKALYLTEALNITEEIPAGCTATPSYLTIDNQLKHIDQFIAMLNDPDFWLEITQAFEKSIQSVTPDF